MSCTHPIQNPSLTLPLANITNTCVPTSGGTAQKPYDFCVSGNPSVLFVSRPGVCPPNGEQYLTVYDDVSTDLSDASSVVCSEGICTSSLPERFTSAEFITMPTYTPIEGALGLACLLCVTIF